MGFTQARDANAMTLEIYVSVFIGLDNDRQTMSKHHCCQRN
jgi:hypothetical protein